MDAKKTPTLELLGGASADLQQQIKKTIENFGTQSSNTLEKPSELGASAKTLLEIQEQHPKEFGDIIASAGIEIQNRWRNMKESLNQAD